MKKTSQQAARRGPKGRVVAPQALLEVQALLRDAPRSAAMLIQYLHRIQDAWGQLSRQHLAALAQELKLAQAEVYEVASFYHHFELEPPLAPAYDASAKVGAGASAPESAPSSAHTPAPAPVLPTVRVCNGLSCSMAGSRTLFDNLASRPDLAVRVIEAPCIGRCAEAPAVCLGQNAFGAATVANVEEAIKQNRFTAPPIDLPPSTFAAETWATLGQCLRGQLTREYVIAQLSQAGLRGLGGAGFPTGRKWKIVSEQPGPRLMAVNIDEGEPGTFKDRWFLENRPQAFLEGMLIAAWAVQAEAVYIYLRDEYHSLRAMLEKELVALPQYLAQAFDPALFSSSQRGEAGRGEAGARDTAKKQADSAKSDPAPFWPTLHLHRGAGAYICGEESAMLESIEGKRGLPRLRPPFVAEVGLFGRPTLVQNLETLCWVPQILRDGPDSFARHGRNGRQGLRSFSVSGRVQKPGVYLADAGISLRELIAEYCGGMLPGHELYAYLPGGASGGILPASLAHVPLDFDTLQAYGCFIGSAAIIVLSQHDSARLAAQNMLEFFSHESCGQCTPCRVGCEQAVQLLAAEKWDIPLLQELGQVMADASICGLGQAAPNPFLSVIKFFPHEVA
jgi:formate dehydrogenase